MRYKFFFVLICLSCFLFISACNFSKKDSSQTPSSAHNPLYQKQQPMTQNSSDIFCQTDTDCILANKSCCGCHAGGESIAIHKSQKKSYRNELKARCSAYNVMCPALYRCDDFKAQFRNSKCVAVEVRN